MNYYEILKIPKSASDGQIKSSYKELVKKYHPDLYVGDKDFAEHKIKEINEAYEVLSNPETKSEYDEYLNLSTNPILTYTETTTHTPSDIKTEAEDTTENSEPQWSFSKFITEKLDKLDKKKQLQIFIFILILILALFLINLIEVKYYLNHPEKNKAVKDHYSNTTNDIDTEFMEEPSDEDLYYEGNYQTLDDLFYDLLQTYENELSNETNSFQNAF